MGDFYKKKYLTKQGETWDLISLAFYGTTYNVAQLIAANPSHARTLFFEADIALNVPKLAEKLPSSLPPWKR